MNEALRAVLDDDTRPPTVGRQLDAVARRIAERHRWTSAVNRSLEPPLRRAQQLAGLFAGRFDREESTGGILPMQVRPAVPLRPAQGPSWPLSAGDPSVLPAPGDGRALPLDVRTRVRGLAGDGIDALRVHDDADADRVARAHAADAVAIGADVYFREGRFLPDEPAGLGLLAHEATHVSAALAKHADGRTSPDDPALEEGLALAREQLAADTPPSLLPELHGSADPRPSQFVPDGGAAVTSPSGRGRTHGWSARAGAPAAGTRDAATPRAVPAPMPVPPVAAAMTAAVDRPTVSTQPGLDVDALRRDLVAELMSRLRSDFERGA